MKRNILLFVITAFLYSFTVPRSANMHAAPVKPVKQADHDRTNGPKKNSVKIYPNPSNGRISVSANTNAPLHFYIFDLEGTLVYQAILKNKDRKTIDNLKKGTYLYDVFEKDESIDEGKIIVK